jgi:hypothetical protein
MEAPIERALAAWQAAQATGGSEMRPGYAGDSCGTPNQAASPGKPPGGPAMGIRRLAPEAARS